jgi:hypothetical protein
MSMLRHALMHCRLQFDDDELAEQLLILVVEHGY